MAASLPSWPPRSATITPREKYSKARADCVGRAAFSMRAASASVRTTFRVRAYATGSVPRRVDSSASGTTTGSRATESAPLAFISSSRGWITRSVPLRVICP